VCAVAAPYSGAMSVVKDYLAGFSDADLEAVLGGNAQRFWKLMPPQLRAESL
jgi:predicted TIM-barrel fold metal-dependent hydrolase